MSPENDRRLLKFDFIRECGDIISSFGLALSMAAEAQNPQLVGIVLLHCRRALLEALSELETLDDGGLL